MPSGIKGSTPKATCHPERSMHCKGLCLPCYFKTRKRRTSDALYRKKHKKDILKRSRLWKKNNPKRFRERQKASRIFRKFGLTQEEYKAKLLLQNNTCALCGKQFTGIGHADLAPVLDHSHATGNNRDFIHNRCNRVLGLINDDPKLCRMAAEYLEKHIGDLHV